MKIAVLSGKGGTGKTLVSVNLAAVLGIKSENGNVSYVDCDVEEPNGGLFLKSTNIIEEKVSVKIPVVNKELCTGCRKCVSFCKFNALAFIKDKVLVFDEVCHSCGGCGVVCDSGAISEKDRVIGVVRKGVAKVSCNKTLNKSGKVNVFSGMLNTGEVSGIPVIRSLLKDSCGDGNNFENIIIDCPPGCACSVMESIELADYCILVAEPTIFGVHNLEMVYELVKMFGKKFGIALNKSLEGENPSEKFAIDHGVPIVGRIPFDKNLGLINSKGGIVSLADEKYWGIFSNILENVEKEVLK